MEIDSTALDVDNASLHFARLNTDAVQQITALLPSSSVLSLTAVSHELGRVFCPAVLSLAVSKVSLRASSLDAALASLSQRYPLLTDLDLSESGATDEAPLEDMAGARASRS